MPNAEGGSVVMEVLDFEDLPKPWLVSLVNDFSDSSMRLALFGTCRGLSQLVVEHCSTLHLRPAVAELRQRPENCAALSRLATGCNDIHFQLQGGSIPIAADVAPNVTELTLIDTHLNVQTISRLRMQRMDRMHKITFSYKDKSHRHSAQLEEDVLFAVLPRNRSAAGKPYHVVHLRVESAHADDVYNTLKRLHHRLGGSLQTLEISQVSAVKALGLYDKLTALTIDDDQVLTDVEQLLLITHPTLKHVSMPGTLWQRGPDHSNHTWPLATLKLSYWGGSSYTLASLPLQGVKKLMIEGGLKGMSEMYMQMLVSLQRCHEVAFKAACGYHFYTQHGIPEDMPVLQLDNCLDPQVMQYVMQRYTGTCLWLDETQSPLHLHHLGGLAHIPAHVTTLALASWKPSCVHGCSWIDVWRHLPAHCSHLVLAQVFITMDDMLAIFDEPLRPALRRVTLTFRPGSTATGWVYRHNAAYKLAAMARAKWGDSVQLVFKMTASLHGDGGVVAWPGGVGCGQAEFCPVDAMGPYDAPAL